MSEVSSARAAPPIMFSMSSRDAQVLRVPGGRNSPPEWASKRDKSTPDSQKCNSKTLYFLRILRSPRGGQFRAAAAHLANGPASQERANRAEWHPPFHPSPAIPPRSMLRWFTRLRWTHWPSTVRRSRARPRCRCRPCDRPGQLAARADDYVGSAASLAGIARGCIDDTSFDDTVTDCSCADRSSVVDAAFFNASFRHATLAVVDSAAVACGWNWRWCDRRPCRHPDVQPAAGAGPRAAAPAGGR